MASPDSLSGPLLRPWNVLSCAFDGLRLARTLFVGMSKAMRSVILWPRGFQRRQRSLGSVSWRRVDVLLESLLVHIPVGFSAVKRIDWLQTLLLSQVDGNWRPLTDMGSVSSHK